jgi:hypothetical protein
MSNRITLEISGIGITEYLRSMGGTFGDLDGVQRIRLDSEKILMAMYDYSSIHNGKVVKIASASKSNTFRDFFFTSPHLDVVCAGIPRWSDPVLSSHQICRRLSSMPAMNSACLVFPNARIAKFTCLQTSRPPRRRDQPPFPNTSARFTMNSPQSRPAPTVT